MHNRDNETDPCRIDALSEIFARALDLNGLVQEEFLETQCAGNVELLAELRSLLRQHEEIGDFLEARTPTDISKGAHSQGGTTTVGPLSGETIGRYKLLEVIGEGGFGIVYLAEQHDPVRRQVALKVIKLGMDTRQVIARFEAERQALAMMDHPGIARVFDAGSTEAGRLYFVMELVRGESITDYCDSQQLNTRARLELFVRVCLAVQHAHQKGVIHRDIKPSNVLVSMQDGVATPKVIDFGIAKATNAEFAERTVFTEQRQIIGTPAYMSPEQAGMIGSDIDTRSDVYGLGVLFYELLTGTTPFDPTRLLGLGYDEMMRIIREEEPEKPSTRLLTLGDTGTHVAECRRTDTRKLRTTLRGDLDWIAMKCLEKDRARRYATAGALAEDIQRYLADEPVIAGAPTATYRLRKFVRRYRGAVAAGVLLALILIGATAVSTAYAWREAAARERERFALEQQVEQSRRADREAAEAKRQTEVAQAALHLAEQRTQETRQVAEFQANMLRNLDASVLGHGIRDEFRMQVRLGLERETIDGTPGRRARTAAELDSEISSFDASAGVVQGVDLARRVMDKFVLSSAVKTAQEQFARQPLVQAEIQDALGAAYRALGLYDAAEAQYREALAIRRRELGDKHLDIAKSLNNVASLLYNKGEFAAAEPLCNEALAIQRGLVGDENPEVVTTLLNLATLAHQAGELDKAEGLYREALALARRLQGDQHPELTFIMSNLASLLATKGDLATAETLFREALELRKVRVNEQASVAVALQNLADVLRSKGDLDGAESLFREALGIQRERLGNEHEQVALILSNFASLLKAKGELPEAESLYRESIAVYRKALGNSHPDLANPLNNYAVLLRDRGDYAAAEPLYREAIAILEKHFSPGHPLIGNSRAGLGRLLTKSAADPSMSSELREARLDESEALLLSAEEELEKNSSAPGSSAKRKRLIGWLVELYETRSVHNPDKAYGEQASLWTQKLEQFNATP